MVVISSSISTVHGTVPELTLRGQKCVPISNNASFPFPPCLLPEGDPGAAAKAREVDGIDSGGGHEAGEVVWEECEAGSHPMQHYQRHRRLATLIACNRQCTYYICLHMLNLIPKWHNCRGSSAQYCKYVPCMTNCLELALQIFCTEMLSWNATPLMSLGKIRDLPWKSCAADPVHAEPNLNPVYIGPGVDPT
jgi:hypothetical protein